jgi:uncharacterized protein YgiM (DUF1202 family)
MGIIVLLSVSICFLLFSIVTRPRYSTALATPEAAVIIETSEEAILSTEETDTTIEPQIETPTDSTLRGKTSSKVNIRDSASTDAKVLATVEAGTTFDIIEVQSDGWTRIQYNGSTAYISSDYVILLNE